MNIKELLTKPIIISNTEINELSKIIKDNEHDDIPDIIAYSLSAIIKNSGFRGKKEK